MSEATGEAQYDPFGKDVEQAQLIVSLKIYDVLMALLTSADPRTAEVLDRLHTSGKIIGVGPTFTEFVKFDRDDDEQSLPDN